MAGDDPVREAEKRTVKEAQDRAAQPGRGEWNKEAAERGDAKLSAEERAERAAIADLPYGVGCPFGGVPDRASIREAIKRMSPEIQALLRDPNAEVGVMGTASRVGTKDFNMRLSQERAEAVAEVLRSDPAVKAKIREPQGVGFDGAIVKGSRPGRDNRYDRVVTLGRVIEIDASQEPTQPEVGHDNKKTAERTAPYQESVDKSGPRAERAKLGLEKEEVPEGLDERNGPLIIEEDWNDEAVERQEAPLSKEEQAERAAVASPKDGIGCPFGGVPAHEAIEAGFAGLSPEKKALLRNPDAVVRLTGMASRVGSAEFNERLSRHRAERVADFLRNDPEVKARIEVDGQGFDTAVTDGHPPDKDNRNDRIVLVEIELEGKGAPDRSKQGSDQPAQPKVEASESPKDRIPEQYAKGYKVGRERAEKIYARTWGWQGPLMGIFNPANAAAAYTWANNFEKYTKVMEKAKNVDEKLWKIPPLPGFLDELRKPNGMEEWKVKGWLREGGYDPGTMFKEYVIHWIRKGKW